MYKDSDMMDAYLRCKIRKGLFSDEVAVFGTSADGNSFSLFVPEESVELRGLPRDAAVDGLLRVEILDEGNGQVLVRLPAQAFENGTTLVVRDAEVERRRPRELA